MAETLDLVKRLLDTHDIARVVPRLAPEVLHRVIEHVGLEAAADIVALATPRQFERLLDIDLWHPPAPGRDDALDTDRFGEWIDVLVQAGVETAADRLAGMDVELVIGGLSDHLAVFDSAAAASYETLDGETVEGRAARPGQAFEVGGFLVEGRPSSAWGPIVELLVYLQAERPVFFDRVMRGCVGLSSGAREADGFHILLGDRDQARADLAAQRGVRRDAQGYVAPAEARAFLEAARQINLKGAPPPADPIAHASLRDLVPEPLSDGPLAGADVTPDPVPVAAATAAVMDLLTDAGVVARPRALLGAGEPADTRLALVHALIESHPTAPEELAFLANAVLGGCVLQGRPFTEREAADAVLATCNLGLENWPARWSERNLVTAFQVGWTLLHRELCRYAAKRLIDTLAKIECVDQDVKRSLRMLRREVMGGLRDGEPWRASRALEAILMLDATAWAVLRALLDECPTLHAALTATVPGVLRVDPAAFTFVARNSEIAVAHDYLATLAVVLAA